MRPSPTRSSPTPRARSPREARREALSRPLSQGANPGAHRRLQGGARLCGRYLVRAVHDQSDREARENMMWAATRRDRIRQRGRPRPHGMAYAVAGLVDSFSPDGYPHEEPMVPHGMSVIVNAPAVFRRIGATSRSATSTRPSCSAPMSATRSLARRSPSGSPR